MNNTIKLLKRAWNPSHTVIRHYPFPAPFRHFLQNYPNTQYSKLCNGLTIVTEERENSPNACIGLYIDAGSRYESPLENGIAHFFEHLVFKGTTSRTKHDLETSITSLGANFRSMTTRDMVCYYAECLSPVIPVVTDLLCDCVFNNTHLKAEIEAQKCVVYSEMLEHEEDSNKVLYDYLHSSAFQGTPLANTVMGPSSNLYNFDVNTMKGYLKKFFDPARTVLAAYGGIKHEQIVGLATCYLNHLRPIQFPDTNVYRYTGSEVRFRDDSMPMGNVAIAVEGPCLCEDENIVMEVAKYIIGSWDRSQLSGNVLPCRLARDASSNHICDAYKCFNINYKDTGLWGVQFLGEVSKLDIMCVFIQDEWLYLCNCVTESEVERAKNFLMTKILTQLQSSTAVCHDLGRWTLYNGCRPSILERLTAIERVHASDVREVCTRYVYNKCPTVASVGRVEGLMPYSRVRSGMYWLRL